MLTELSVLVADVSVVLTESSVLLADLSVVLAALSVLVAEMPVVLTEFVCPCDCGVCRAGGVVCPRG